jgi:rubrerythrin
MHEQPADYVEFFATGQSVLGHFRCSECNYGVAIQHELPLCPMCGGTAWEETVDASKPRLH